MSNTISGTLLTISVHQPLTNESYTKALIVLLGRISDLLVIKWSLLFVKAAHFSLSFGRQPFRKHTPFTYAKALHCRSISVEVSLNTFRSQAVQQLEAVNARK